MLKVPRQPKTRSFHALLSAALAFIVPTSGLATNVSANPLPVDPLSTLPTSSELPSDVARLSRRLGDVGVDVRFEPPPERGAYGMFDSAARTIWIHPVVFELGNARATIVHEAVHAAQGCAGGAGGIQPLQLEIPPPVQTRRFFVHYQSYRRQLEAEAYTVQTQPNSIEMAIALLDEWCT